MINTESRIPDGAILIYPVTIRDRTTSSRIEFANDIILHQSFRKVFSESYLNKEDDFSHWLLTPMNAPDDLLAKFPMTFIITASQDPLKDDGVLFHELLTQKSNEKCVLKEYQVKVMVILFSIELLLGIYTWIL